MRYYKVKASRGWYDADGYAQQHSPVCNTVCRPVPVVNERSKV
jgi:hypothetical protein